MPRKVRIEYPGAMYHIMSRGDRREDIGQTELSITEKCVMQNISTVTPSTPCPAIAGELA